MSDFNYVTASVAVLNHERKSVRLESTYDALAKHLSITVDSESDVVTDAARFVVVTGANNDDTVMGKSITAEMLKGRDPGADASHRAYWKAARAVRIGLVNAAKRAAGESDDPESTTDYLARIVKAVEAGKKHNLTAEQILDAVKSHV